MNMRTIKLTIGILGISTLFAFTTKTKNNEEPFIGTYGDKNSCEITLNKDFTYTYYFHKKRKNIVSKGNWKTENGTILLTKNNFRNNIRTIWTLENDGRSIKSTKNWTTITLSKHCN